MHRPDRRVASLVAGLALLAFTLSVIPATTATATQAATAIPGGSYQPMTPERLLDTADGTGAPPGPVASHATVTFQVTGHSGVPAAGIGAVVLNVTVASPAANGYVTAFPTGLARPATSTVNFAAGQTVPNLAVVRLGTGGKVSLYNGSAGSVRLIADISGYYTAGTATLPGTFSSLAPARLLDTGVGTGAPRHSVAAHAALTFQVTGRGGVPTTGVSSVALNVTAASPAARGYLTAYPSGAARPVTSSLNFTAGRTTANAVVVRLGTGGRVTIYNGSAGSVRLVADVSGYFRSGTVAQPGAFTALAPTRVLDTGAGLGAPKTPLGPDEELTFQLAGHGGVPASGASAVILNVTVAAPARNGFLTVYPGSFRPRTSNLNFQAGHDVANLVMARVRADGKVSVYNNSSGSVRVIADVAGYYRPTPSSLTWGAGTAPAGSGSLGSVSCASSTFCAAVNNTGQAVTFNGSSWSGPTAAAAGAALTSVSCPTTTFCAAVGDQVVTTFDGSVWSAPVTIEPAGGLTTVSCASATFCMAVSSIGFGFSSTGHAFRFNGATWTTSLSASRSLTGLSCASASFCVASTDNGNFYTFDGTDWSAPDSGLPFDDMALSCTSSSFCAAAGHGQALTFDGTSWSAPATIDTQSSVTGVSCTSSSHCLLSTGDIGAATFDGASWSTPAAVMSQGNSYDSSISCVGATFCELVANDGYASTFNGATWSSAVAAAPTTGSSEGLSCSSVTSCVEVTSNGAALKFNGSAWSAPVQLLDRKSLFAVSCPTTTYCLAANGEGGEAVTFDGTTPGPVTVDGLPSAGVVEIDCASPTFCVAAAGGMSATFDGTSWTAPVSVGLSFVSSLSCPVSGVCLATGGHDSARFDGTSWTKVAVSADESYGPLDCVSVVFCISAGYADALQIGDYPPFGGDSATYNGSTWSGPTMIDPGGWAQSISCVSTTFCAAAESDGSVVTYDGTRWSQPISLETQEHYSTEMAASCPTVNRCYALSFGTGKLYVGSS